MRFTGRILARFIITLSVAVVLAAACASKGLAQTNSAGETRAAIDSKAASRSAAAQDGASATGNAQSQEAGTGEWHFQFTPYLWIARIHGDAGVGPVVVHVDSSILDSSVHINFGFMSTFEARKNRMLMLADFQYSDLGTTRATAGPLFSGARADFSTLILDPEVGYRLVDHQEKVRFVDALAGIRYWRLTPDITLTPGILPGRSASASRAWVDGVFGLRGRAALSRRLFLVGKGDVGAGGSDLTYQLFGAVGLEAGKRVNLYAGYRYISVDYNRNNFLFDVSISGPILGFGLRLGK